MQEQQSPRPNQATRRFSDEEASEIYKRAAQIESKTLFTSESDTLSRDQLENAANKAGISDRAVQAAIDQIERERVEAQQNAVAKSQKTRTLLAVGVGVALILAGNGILTQRGFSTRMASVENYKSNIDVALQRRQDLIPNVLALAKAKLSNDRELIAALSQPNVDSTTLQLARQRLENQGVESGTLDELAGAENRINQTRRQYNGVVAEYNRNASSFPASFWRPIFGFPKRVEPFAADKSAQVAPQF